MVMRSHRMFPSSAKDATMQANPHLTIVIPTFNRGEFLDQCLAVNLPQLRAHGIAVVIMDNASSDDTEMVVSRYARQYPLLSCHRHAHNIGVEENTVFSLQHPQTRFVWILADTYQVPEGGIEYVLDVLSSGKGYDAVVLNIAGKKKNLETRDFFDGNELLYSIGSVMTCLSCLVINKKVIESTDFERYSGSRFVQTGIIFESIANRPFTVHFAQAIAMSSLVNFKENKNAWSKVPLVFEIACECWVNFVYSLPFCYCLESKQRCIRDLTEVSTIFSLPHLLSLRCDGIYNYGVYLKYRHLFPLTINLPGWLVAAVAVTPAPLLHILLAAKRSLRELKSIF